MKKGDIVQITEETHPWHSCLIIVDKIIHQGIRGYINIPKNDKEIGTIYIRLSNGEFEIVGKACLMFT